MDPPSSGRISHPPHQPYRPPTTPVVLGEILSFGLWMRKQGYKESTIQPRIRALKSLARRANLLDPESVKSYLASAELSESRKEKFTNDLARFYGYKHIPFDRPRYIRVEKLPSGHAHRFSIGRQTLRVAPVSDWYSFDSLSYSSSNAWCSR